MKSLHTLLKIAQRKLDELGVEAQRIQVQVDEMRQSHASLLAREQAEVAKAAADMALAPYLPAYRARIRQQGGAILSRVAEVETTLGLVRERLSAAYQEKSKFEQLIEQQRIRDAMERAAADQKQLDEVAINRAGRS